MKKPIIVSLILLNLPLKAFMLEAPTACWSSWFYPLITLLEKKYLQQSRVGLHRILTSFQECPLVPFMLLSKVKSSFNVSLDNPLHILETSIRSCLFFFPFFACLLLELWKRFFFGSAECFCYKYRYAFIILRLFVTKTEYSKDKNKQLWLDFADNGV